MGQFGLRDQMTLGAGFFFTVNLLPGSGSFSYHMTPRFYWFPSNDRQLSAMP